MANRGQKPGSRGHAKVVERPDPPDIDFPGKPDGEESLGPGIPRWRQIEIMHERAQLRRMLDDLDMDFDELEAEVFGSEEEHDVFYRNHEDADEEEIELDDEDDDEFEEDDFEDLEE